MIPRKYLSCKVILPTGACGIIIGISNAANPANYLFVRLDNRRRTVRVWEADIATLTILGASK